VAAAQPTILLNVSNLAWFGDTIALGQHLDIARMRSLETGRPSIRATNTGMTAHIDHKGRVLAASPAMQQDILLARVQGTQGATPFSYVGNSGALLISTLAILICLLQKAGLTRSGRAIGRLS
jgi:apolipoprotein N-acyltransferase